MNNITGMFICIFLMVMIYAHSQKEKPECFEFEEPGFRNLIYNYKNQIKINHYIEGRFQEQERFNVIDDSLYQNKNWKGYRQILQDSILTITDDNEQIYFTKCECK